MIKLTIFSPMQCGLGKGHSGQHCLLALVEKWRGTLDTKQGAGMIYPSFLRHGLLIAKCYA